MVVILTPVEFGCCNSQVKNFIDRTEPLFLPIQVIKDGNTVMKGRYVNYPKLIFVGIKENGSPDCMRASRTLLKKVIWLVQVVTRGSAL
jgi:multimeric flavodoxin WrbA